jgi:predicted translin family RNA/ssDNA-binding protein
MDFSLPVESFQTFEQARRKGLKLSDELRVESKSAIGFLLKGMNKEADKSLLKAGSIYEELKALLKESPYLHSIGGVHVGTEEYVEAKLLADYLEGKPLSTLEALDVTHDSYICGLCDTSGELLRFARKNPERMKQIESDLEDLHQACLTMVVTRNGLIRKKLEDLERNVKRMEDMIFQWDLKHA